MRTSSDQQKFGTLYVSNCNFRARRLFGAKPRRRKLVNTLTSPAASRGTGGAPSVAPMPAIFTHLNRSPRVGFSPRFVAMYSSWCVKDARVDGPDALWCFCSPPVVILLRLRHSGVQTRAHSCFPLCTCFGFGAQICCVSRSPRGHGGTRGLPTTSNTWPTTLPLVARARELVKATSSVHVIHQEGRALSSQFLDVSCRLSILD